MTDTLAQNGLAIATRIGLGLLLFIAGYVVAKILTAMARKALARVRLDSRLSKRFGSRGGQVSVEKPLTMGLFFLLMIMVVIAVLDFAGLTTAAGPLGGVVSAIMMAIPAIGKAAIIVIVAWVIGATLQKLVTKAVDGMGVEGRLAKLTDEPTSAKKDGSTLGGTVGRIVFWLVMLMAFGGVVDALAIGPLVDPVRGLLATVLGVLPTLAVAAIIGLIGWVVAKVARAVITGLLSSGGFDSLPARLKMEKVFEKRSASEIVGLVVFGFILLQTAVAVLGKLGIDTLAGPLTGMMASFWTMLPALAVSAIIIAAGIIIGRIARDVVAGVLEGLGFDSVLDKLGLSKVAERDERLKHPSRIAGTLVFAAIILVATVQALQNLGLGAWAGYVDTFLAYTVQSVLPALIIVGIAMVLGRMVKNMIAPETADVSSERRWVATGAHMAILVFAATMALQQLNVAPVFVATAFSLLFGALCLALALAFGLGSREVAGEIVRTQYDKALTRRATVKAPTSTEKAA